MHGDGGSPKLLKVKLKISYGEGERKGEVDVLQDYRGKVQWSTDFMLLANLKR